MTTTVVAQVSQFLGRGMYTLAEAAMYAHVTPQLLRRWLWDSRSSRATFSREIESTEKLITFVDFIQCLTVRAVRLQQKIPLQTIRDAVDHLHAKYKITHPFARAHELFALDDQIVYRHPDFGDILVSGKQKDQSLMRPVVQDHLERISYDFDGLANIYQIDQVETFPITMRAKSRFGEPTMPSGYTAQALWDAVRIEGSYEKAAKAAGGGVTVAEVRAAFRFYNQLLPAA